VLREILALDFVEEPFYDFWLRLLVLETDQLQSGLSTIGGQNLNVNQTQGFHAVILDLSNGCQISLRVYVHGAEEILRIVSVCLNCIHYCVKRLLVY
jgi:hypothetical protein